MVQGPASAAPAARPAVAAPPGRSSDSTAGSDSGGGGGGFDSSGGDGEFGDGGASFLAGGAGGIGASLDTAHNGGFGGGGGANSDSIGGGGGGGFSGGGGGEDNVGGGGGSFVAPVATDVTLTAGENADGNGSITIALAAVAPDVFSDVVAASSGPLSGFYLWSNPANWSAGVPADGASVSTAAVGFDDIASLSLANLSLSATAVVAVGGASLDVTSVAGTSGSQFGANSIAGAPVTVTVQSIGGTGGLYGAVGAGTTFVDQAATDNGEIYVAQNGRPGRACRGAVRRFLADFQRYRWHDRAGEPRREQRGGDRGSRRWRHAGAAGIVSQQRHRDRHLQPDGDIYAGGQLIGQTLADKYRRDLEQAGLGSGRHSFEFRPPAGLTLTPNSVQVRRSLDGAALLLTAGVKRTRSLSAA